MLPVGSLLSLAGGHGSGARPAAKAGLIALTCFLPGTAWAQNCTSAAAALTPVITPAVWQPLSAPVIPVAGSDGRIHLAFELEFLNRASGMARLEAVRVNGTLQETGLMHSESGQPIAGLLHLFAQKPEDTKMDRNLGPGEGGLMFFDASSPNTEAVPASLEIAVTQSLPGLANGRPVEAAGASIPVCGTPIVLQSPLRGPGWVNADGCCAVLSAHRGAALPLNGALWLAQRFAIDFVRIDDQRRALKGAAATNVNWIGYGAPVLAAAPGTIVEARDDLQDGTPGAFPSSRAVEDAPGNHVIQDLGGGRFALYAHLRPGSLRVKAGDRVEAGAQLGELGNTGNSDAPHLHFQIMDRASALVAHGLPFVFAQWTLEGRAPERADEMEKPMMAAAPLSIETERAGPQRNTMPMQGDVAGF